MGEGIGTELAFVVGANQSLLIDMTGASVCELSQMRITSRINIADIGLLLARNASLDSAGEHQFDGLRWEAPAKIANVVSLGSEVNTYTHCSFLNAAPGGQNLITSRFNTLQVISPYGASFGGSNLCQQYINCVWGVYARTGREINISIQSGTGYFQIIGGSMSNKSLDRKNPNAGGLAGIQIGGPDNDYPCEQIIFTYLEAETHGTKNAIQILGYVRGLRVQNCLFQSCESAIRITGKLEDSIIEQNSLQAGMATYDWRTDPKRALIVVKNASVSTSKFDLRWRRLGVLNEDKSTRDSGNRPDIALCVSCDKPEDGFYENEVIVRNKKDIWFSETTNTSNNQIRVLTP